MLILSRFTVPVAGGGDSETKEKLFYKWEDALLWKVADVSFTFKATFRYLDAEGNK